MNKRRETSFTRKILNAVRRTAVRNADMASMMGTFEVIVPVKLRREVEKTNNVKRRTIRK